MLQRMFVPSLILILRIISRSMPQALGVQVGTNIFAIFSMQRVFRVSAG